MEPDNADNAGPIPWRPAGKLAPQRGSPGEWHAIPVDGFPHPHSHECPCEPELTTVLISTGMKTLWVHKWRGPV